MAKIALSAAITDQSNSGPWPAENAPLIALDIGHSLTRPGAMSARGVPELEFNRNLATVIDAELENRSFRTRVINSDGKTLSLVDRARQSEDVGFFLSIHHDSVQSKYLSTWLVQGKSRPYSDRFHGFSLFVSRLNHFPSKSEHCASEIGKALKRAGFNPSRYHAEPIPGENRPFADEANGVHYFDDLVVLKKARSPAVLLEAGVILNRAEEENMARPTFKIAIANAVVDALTLCIDNEKLD